MTDHAESSRDDDDDYDDDWYRRKRDSVTGSRPCSLCDVTSERQNENIIGGDLRSAMISPAAARKSSAKVVINGRTN